MAMVDEQRRYSETRAAVIGLFHGAADMVDDLYPEIRPSEAAAVELADLLRALEALLVGLPDHEAQAARLPDSAPAG